VTTIHFASPTTHAKCNEPCLPLTPSRRPSPLADCSSRRLYETLQLIPAGISPSAIERPFPGDAGSVRSTLVFFPHLLPNRTFAERWHRCPRAGYHPVNSVEALKKDLKQRPQPVKITNWPLHPPRNFGRKGCCCLSSTTVPLPVLRQLHTLTWLVLPCHKTDNVKLMYLDVIFGTPRRDSHPAPSPLYQTLQWPVSSHCCEKAKFHYAIWFEPASNQLA